MRKLLRILFCIIICVCAILPYVSNWFGWSWSKIQSDTAWIGFNLGFIGAIWTEDGLKKSKYVWTALLAVSILTTVLGLRR